MLLLRGKATGNGKQPTRPNEILQVLIIFKDARCDLDMTLYPHEV